MIKNSKILLFNIISFFNPKILKINCWYSWLLFRRRCSRSRLDLDWFGGATSWRWTDSHCSVYSSNWWYPSGPCKLPIHRWAESMLWRQVGWCWWPYFSVAARAANAAASFAGLKPISVHVVAALTADVCGIVDQGDCCNALDLCFWHGKKCRPTRK